MDANSYREPFGDVKRVPELAVSLADHREWLAGAGATIEASQALARCDADRGIRGCSRARGRHAEVGIGDGVRILRGVARADVAQHRD